MSAEWGWPKRMAISDFRKIGFVGKKAPSITTLKRWIDNGQIPGEKLGTMYYVWVNQTLELEKPPSAELISKMKTGNEVADRIAARFIEQRIS